MSNDTTRTFKATIRVILDGAVLEVRQHILKITGRTLNTIVATLDGLRISVERARQITEMALENGSFEKIAETAPTTIGKRAASALHADLSRLTYTHEAHYEIASAAVGRELLSLTELTETEVPIVWAHACLVRGYSTPVTRYYGKAVAA
ncbi:hypothetical protein [Deinococcus sp. UYEF24]